MIENLGRHKQARSPLNFLATKVQHLRMKFVDKALRSPFFYNLEEIGRA